MSQTEDPHTLTALIVEDDMLMADKAEAMLIELGYQRVLRADDINGAIKTIDGQSFDVVLLDASLRGAPSYKVAAHLRMTGIPFIVATGHDFKRLPNEFAFGILLQKPYGASDLVRALQAALSHTAG